LRLAVSIVVAVGLSILACWGIAAVGVAIVPSMAGYEHFQFVDYSKLTIIGVVIAGLAWPVATLLSSDARRLYLLSAVVVVVVSFAPDLWILHGGQPIFGVAVLMVMHCALGVVTYPVIVYGAPQRRSSAS
jgi:hypothetical protein